jgi:hypothetical protein
MIVSSAQFNIRYVLRGEWKNISAIHSCTKSFKSPQKCVNIPLCTRIQNEKLSLIHHLKNGELPDNYTQTHSVHIFFWKLIAVKGFSYVQIMPSFLILVRASYTVTGAMKTFQLHMPHMVSHFSKEIWQHMDIPHSSSLLRSPAKDISSNQFYAKLSRALHFGILIRCVKTFYIHTTQTKHYISFNKLAYLTDSTFVTFSQRSLITSFLFAVQHSKVDRAHTWQMGHRTDICQTTLRSFLKNKGVITHKFTNTISSECITNMYIHTYLINTDIYLS